MTPTPDRLPRAMSLAVHELRTPVTVVAGYLRMLLREQAGPLNDKQRKMLEEAERSCGRLSGLVSEMSDFGKLEGGQMPFARQEFDLSNAAAELAKELHDGGDRGVYLELRASIPVMVAGDRARLGAAVKALMQSALRERVEPGALLVSTGIVGGRWAVLAIGDETVLPELEQGAEGSGPPFDEWRGGLGLALPIARQVIEAHGGALWSGAGSHSRAASAFRLPLTPQEG